MNIPQEGFAPWAEVKAEFADYPSDIPSYVRLNVEVDGYLPSGANDEANAIAGEKACRFCLINSKRKDNSGGQGKRCSFTTSEFKQLDTTDVARMWIESKGDVFDESMREIIQEVKKDVMINPDNTETL